MSIIVFIFGLIVGSFINCVIYRVETGKSFLKGRSYCPKCKHTLGFFDLIPVFSFLFLKGRCRYCKEKISWQYPIVEIATGLVFLMIPYSLLLYALFALLILIFIYDLKHYIIPDSFVIPAMVFAFAYRLDFKFILSGILASLFFLIIFLASKGQAMGFGDVKLAFLMGLFLGFPNIIVSLFFAFFIGAIIGVSLIILKKKGMKSEIPFGPFLLIGLLIAFLWGNDIVRWYLSLIL